MKGADAVFAMRRAGKRPKGVWITQTESPYCLMWQKYDDLQAYPEVEILPHENPESLDLRFVVGLTVHVSSKKYDLGKKLHHALLKSGAKRVITVVGGVLIDSETGETDDYVPD
jgi:hypothetical protein